MISSRRLERIRQVLAKRQKDLTLILSNIHDPHNVSAILRSCDAFGVHRVHLYYTTTAFPSLGKKSSASGKKWVEIVRHREPGPMLDAMKAQGYQILATAFDEDAVSLHEVDLTKPTAIALGNEHSGVGPELRQAADHGLYIPMQGMIQSFNVSVAAAIILHEAHRQRLGQQQPSDRYLTDEEIEELARDWETR